MTQGNSSLLLGCIADDLTGATDLCNTLVKGGMRTVQIIGVPSADFDVPDADAVVVALKSRTIPAAEAVAMSLGALEWLRARGARQYFFKYCSTFDSTDAGNIGPVADALRDALSTDFTIACPAFPENRRTIYLGHLFVGDQLLSDSSMRHHPLTPMTDSSLVRVLARQAQGKVGLVPFSVVREGAEAIDRAFAALAREGHAYAIVDALEDAHLIDIGAACSGLTLVTGGSGVAMGLPDNFRRAGFLKGAAAADALPAFGGASAVLAGSCSQATLGQVAAMKAAWPALALDPIELAERADAIVAEAIKWAAGHLEAGPVLVYASQPPDQVKKAQEKLGRERAGAVVEQALARIAVGLADAGVRRLVVAGGETAGAIVQALGVKALRIGPQIDPGVPWTAGIGGREMALALKSGNFGGPDFFAKALGMMA